MTLPPGWVELPTKEGFYQRDDLLCVRQLKPGLNSRAMMEVWFLHPANFDAQDESGLACLIPTQTPFRPGWFEATMARPEFRNGLKLALEDTVTIELLFKIDGLLRRRTPQAPSPEGMKELTDRERIELLEQRVAELTRQLAAR